MRLIATSLFLIWFACIQLLAVCPPRGYPCDDGNPQTFDDRHDGFCNCLGTSLPPPCPPSATFCDDGLEHTINDQEDGACFCSGTLSLEGTNIDSCATDGWQALNSCQLPRHECGFTAVGDKLYLFGGRNNLSLEIYDPLTDNWSSGADLPIEMHHFQAVPLGGNIYVIGAFTGPFPNEKPISRIYTYNLEEDEWIVGPSFPFPRARGSAAAVAHKGKIYVAGGILNGHQSGHVNWLDEFNPLTSEWKRLADAPRARDHIQAAVAGEELYLIGGRRSSINDGEAAVDVYNFSKNEWRTLVTELPTLRSGASTLALDYEIWIIGGESGSQFEAHSEVEIFNVISQNWYQQAFLMQEVHGGGAAAIRHYIYQVAGAVTVGGSEETGTLQRICTKKEQDCPEAGTSCDDGDESTHPDLNDGRCNCIGQQDIDCVYVPFEECIADGGSAQICLEDCLFEESDKIVSIQSQSLSTNELSVVNEKCIEIQALDATIETDHLQIVVCNENWDCSTYDGLVHINPNCGGKTSLRKAFSPSVFAFNGELYIEEGRNGEIPYQKFEGAVFKLKIYDLNGREVLRAGNSLGRFSLKAITKGQPYVYSLEMTFNSETVYVADVIFLK